MAETKQSNSGCVFCAILRGDEPGEVLAQDKKKQFALIRCLHPESSVHWLAIPIEHVGSTEELEHQNKEKFLELVDFAVEQARAKTAEFPQLQNGFTIKFHFGSYETVRHAKLHVLAKE